MGSAAKLDGKSPRIRPWSHSQDADFIAIFFAEQRQRASLNRVIGGHQAGGNSLIAAYLRVHFGFNCCNISRRQRAIMGEIKPKPILSHHATLLCHMVAQRVAECRMQKVGSRMIGTDPVPPRDIDRQVNGIANADATAFQDDMMRVKPTERLRRIFHSSAQAAFARHCPGVTILSTAFAVKWCLIGQQSQGCRGSDCGGGNKLYPVDENSNNLTVAFGCTVTNKFR